MASRAKEKAANKARGEAVQQIYTRNDLEKEIESVRAALADARSKGNNSDIATYSRKLQDLEKQLGETPTTDEALQQGEQAARAAVAEMDRQQAARETRGTSREGQLTRGAEAAQQALAGSDLPNAQEGIQAAGNVVQRQIERTENRTGQDLTPERQAAQERTQQALSEVRHGTPAGSGTGGFAIGDSEDTETTPMEVNTENADKQAEDAISKAVEGATEKVEENNLIEKEAGDLEKLRALYEDISDYGVEGLPTTIMQAYRSGLLGDVGSKDAETARNQLILNQIFNTLGNMGAAWQGKEGTQSLWDTKTAKDWEEATTRKNEKLRTQMEQQLNLSNLAAEDQEKARAAIKGLTSDAYFARAAQQLGNIEDTLGLFELKKSIGNEWGNMDKASKQNVLAAYQLVAGGNVDAAQNAVNSLPQSQQEKIGKALVEAQVKQAQNNNALTAAQAALVNQTVANYGWIQGMQILNQTLSVAGNLIPGL